MQNRDVRQQHRDPDVERRWKTIVWRLDCRMKMEDDSLDTWMQNVDGRQIVWRPRCRMEMEDDIIETQMQNENGRQQPGDPDVEWTWNTIAWRPKCRIEIEDDRLET